MTITTLPAVVRPRIENALGLLEHYLGAGYLAKSCGVESNRAAWPLYALVAMRPF